MHADAERVPPAAVVCANRPRLKRVINAAFLSRCCLKNHF